MKTVTLHKPAFDELAFRRKLLADPDTMSYNRAWGGVISFPEERWSGWYDRWVARPEGKRFYRYVKDGSGAFVGEIAYHVDETTGRFMANVLIAAKCRGNGYGGQALDLLCDAAADAGISVLYDDIAADNPAAGLFLRHGFEEESRTESVILLKKKLDPAVDGRQKDRTETE